MTVALSIYLKIYTTKKMSNNMPNLTLSKKSLLSGIREEDMLVL